MIALQTGTRIGRYLLATRLATGGMAEVWLARSRTGDDGARPVVIKALLPDLAEDPDLVHMFLDEAALAARLDHPNIVHVMESGQAGGRCFIAMEHVPGRTLRQLERQLRRDGKTIPPWFVLSVAESVCNALECAHTQRDEQGAPLEIVHRDVSPENVIVGLNGEVKVLDFGVAKMSTSAIRTKVGEIKGKHAYLSPEQIRAVEGQGRVDLRTDLFSLGIVMYELLTLVRPYSGDNPLALMNSILSQTPRPPSPSSLAPWVAREVDELVMRAMAHDPADRFASAQEMGCAIRHCVDSRSPRPTPAHLAAMLEIVFSGEGASDDHQEAIEALDAAWPSLSGAELGAGTSAGELLPVSLRRGTEATVRRHSASGNTAPYSSRTIDRVIRAARAGLPVPVAELLEDAADPPPTTRRRPETVSAPQRGWDAAVQRIRQENAVATGTPVPPRPESEPPSAVPDTPEAAARHSFERGLRLARARDPQGALEALAEAVELDPYNRLYQTNLRILRRQLDAEEKG